MRLEGVNIKTNEIMEKIIEMQLNRLYDQRESLVNALASGDPNSMNYFNLQNELRNSISQIDIEINNAVLRLPIKP